MKTRSYTRWTLASSVLAFGLLFLALMGVLPTLAAGGDPNTAHIAVQLGNGEVEMRRITFTQPSVNGFEALELAGFQVDSTDSGLVCSIEGMGCPTTNCFCSSSYWRFYHLNNGEWNFSQVGAGAYEVTDGALELFSWGQTEALRTAPLVTQEITATQAALQWLRSRQQANGGYGNPSSTIDTVLAVAAANEDPATWESAEGNSLLDYLEANGASYVQPGPELAERVGKLAMTIAAADQDPRDFGGMDLVISITNAYNPAMGAYGATNWDQAYGMLGWRASGEVIPVTATRELASRINTDGGWGYSTGLQSDVDTTALMLQALVAGGEAVTSTAVLSGVNFLEAAQTREYHLYLPLVLNRSGAQQATPEGGAQDAGFPVVPSQESNANSTAFAVQGLIAAGQDPLGPRFIVDGTTPISYLLSLQLPDGGFAYQDRALGSDVYATQQVIPALVGKPFPYLSRAVAEREALGWIRTRQQPDGSFEGFNPGSTLDAILAIRAAGEEPQSFVQNGNTPLDYLEVQASGYVTQSAAAAGKFLAGVVAAGGEPESFAGLNLVDKLMEFYDAETGAFGSSTFDQSWAIIGLVAAGEAVPANAVTHLRESDAESGGWGFMPNAEEPDVDSTALALQALAAAGVPRATADVDDAFAFLHAAQNPDGGFPGFGGTTDAASTGLALQALAAYDEAPESLTWTTVVMDGTASRLTLHTPVDAVLKLQTTEGGFAGYSGPNDPFSTYQALPGIVGVAYPPRVDD
jgi:prenyltransferase beta subunit